ncbi:SIMPL domain-containing protein [Clostridium sp.]|uniref:SIMPL domain-containing protein n=1 Tax=Clostridium sp. TaxID=1506 RepID=UPI00321782AB
MDDRLIRVNGQGNISVPPDTIQVDMVLITVKPTYEEAIKAAGMALEQLRNCLKEVGFEKEDMKTADFRVNTKYETVKDMNDNYKRVFVGYEVTNHLKIEFEQNSIKLGRVLNALSNCDATPEFSIRYMLKDDTEVNDILLRYAINDAKEKAKVMAEAAGVRLGKVINIDYSGSEFPLYKNSGMFVMADSSKIDLEPANLELKATVTVVWRIES